MGVILSIAVGMAAVVALLMVDLWLDRLMIRALFKAIDRLPPLRPGGRYRSQSMPRKYASLRKPGNGS